MVAPTGELLAEPWASVDVYGEPGSEVGLMGIAVDSTSGIDHEVYVSAVVRNVGSTSVSRAIRGVGRRIARALDPERGHPWTFQVIRLTDRDGRGADQTVLVRGLPSGYLHGGGPLRIGPDGLMYTANGDTAEPNWAQAWSTTRGKVLRYDKRGLIPVANPSPGSAIYAREVLHRPRGLCGVGVTVRI
jgi:hypothetical protein